MTTSLLDFYYQRLLDSFENLFIGLDSKQEILKVISAIQNQEPILPIAEGDNGSFSTIFLPFHAGLIQPFNVKELKANNNLHPKLIRFCELCAEIEGLTDLYSTYENEPTELEKLKLLPKLQEFISILPTYDEFKKWLR
jgi:hypothetical protein